MCSCCCIFFCSINNQILSISRICYFQYVFFPKIFIFTNRRRRLRLKAERDEFLNLEWLFSEFEPPACKRQTVGVHIYFSKMEYCTARI